MVQTYFGGSFFYKVKAALTGLSDALTQLTEKVNGLLMPRDFAKAARALNTAFQLSKTRDAWVSYAVDVTCAGLLAGTSGSVTLEYADDQAMTKNVMVIPKGSQSSGGVVSLATTGSITLSGIIPAGKFARLRTTNASGNPTYGAVSGQEVLL